LSRLPPIPHSDPLDSTPPRFTCSQCPFPCRFFFELLLLNLGGLNLPQEVLFLVKLFLSLSQRSSAFLVKMVTDPSFSFSPAESHKGQRRPFRSSSLLLPFRPPSRSTDRTRSCASHAQNLEPFLVTADSPPSFFDLMGGNYRRPSWPFFVHFNSFPHLEACPFALLSRSPSAPKLPPSLPCHD